MVSEYYFGRKFNIDPVWQRLFFTMDSDEPKEYFKMNYFQHWIELAPLIDSPLLRWQSSIKDIKAIFRAAAVLLIQFVWNHNTIKRSYIEIASANCFENLEEVIKLMSSCSSCFISLHFIILIYSPINLCLFVSLFVSLFAIPS